MSFFVRAVSVALCCISLYATASAQAKAPDEDLRKDIQELKAGQAALQKQLEEIKQILLSKAGQPREPLVSLDGAQSKGDAKATVAIVEFSDYQCPFCGRYFRDAYPQIERDYIQTGKVRMFYRNLPLDSIHPLAMKAAEAAECAGEQGKFWEMHNRLFSNQQALSPADLSAHAKSLGLDAAAYEKCLAEGKQAAGIQDDMAEAAGLGITGTPTFVIGRIQPDGKSVSVLRMVVGAQPFNNFRAALENALGPAAK